MLIDTHSHIYGPEYDEDRDEVIASAQAAGVGHVVLANVDDSTVASMNEAFESYPGYFSMAMGLHPTSVPQDTTHALDVVRKELDRGIYKAVGEIGVDLYWDSSLKAEQLEVFAQQIELALDYKLPIIIHGRKAFAEIFSVLQRYKGSDLNGIFHCFGGGIEEAKKALDYGFLLGIGGVFTYKNSHLKPIVKQVGLDGLVLETDAPYLSPVPYRGKRNEPRFMVEVCRELSELFEVPYEQVCKKTSENAKQLLNIL